MKLSDLPDQTEYIRECIRNHEPITPGVYFISEPVYTGPFIHGYEEGCPY